MTVYYYHVRYAFQIESTRYSCLETDAISEVKVRTTRFEPTTT